MHWTTLEGLSKRFEPSVYGEFIYAYSFQERDIDEWKYNFRSKIENAINAKQFLPVYRMADGEYRFLFGYKIKKKSNILKELIKYTLENKLGTTFTTSWGERYPREEKKKFQEKLLRAIKMTSQFGMLGLFFYRNGLDIYTEYNTSLLENFKKNDIDITDSNYIPFHLPIDLVLETNNPIYKGKKILVISSVGSNEENCINRKLYSYGAKLVQHYKISSTQAFKDCINLSSIKVSPDLVFISAGIASVLLIEQLKSMNCPCIDIGGSIHLLSNKISNYHGFRSSAETPCIS